MRILLSASCVALLLCGCGRDLSSSEEAQRAYLGLDGSLAKALTLGFAGFNAATSANIPPQQTPGDVEGTLTISGQVDSGVSANKQMRLRMGMVDYYDGEVTVGDHPPVRITYDTHPDTSLQPALVLNLRNIPTGTYDGTLAGDFVMQGDVTGEASLDLAISGNLEDDGAGGVRRAAGTTTVTGTASAGGGTYDISLTL